MTHYHSGATKCIGRTITIELASRGASIIGTYSTPAFSPLFSALAQAITALYISSPSTSPSPSSLPPVIAPPKFAGIQSDIATPNSSGAVSTLLEALTTHFAGKLDTVVFGGHDAREYGRGERAGGCRGLCVGGERAVFRRWWSIFCGRICLGGEEGGSDQK
jgi:hypothetical protein